MIVKRRTRGTNGIRPARLAEVSFRLHYAQTQRQSRCQIYTTTWDYTTLKQFRGSEYVLAGFTTTWDYTTLKLVVISHSQGGRFTTTWDYTTLKPRKGRAEGRRGFTTTWDYTTLKPQISKRQVFRSEKWENSPFSYGLEQHSDTTTEYPAAAKRL